MKFDVEKFLEIENKTNAFNIEVNNIYIWERIRFKIQRIISKQNGAGQAHTATQRNFKNYIKGAYSFIKNTFERNPFFADSADILFIGHSRRKQNSDKIWEDIYCDPIHRFCDFDYCHMEMPRLLEHKRPAFTRNMKYLDVVNFFLNLPLSSNVIKIKISDKDFLNIRNLENCIKNTYNIKIDIIFFVRKMLRERLLTSWIYRRILKKINPKLAVVIVGYTNHTFIEACKNLFIPVIELQHGIIDKSHLGYNFPKDVETYFFPDYLFTFGRYWHKHVNLPLPKERIIPVGYPYMDLQKKKYSHKEKEDYVLFISQGPIGKKLSKLAKRLSELSDFPYKVIYKLHPGEYDRWKKIYPWLLDSNAQVIDSDTPQLYELFARSKVQVGVTSTALYEGLSFGLDTYIYSHDSWNIQSPLLDDGLAKQVEGPKDLRNKILNNSCSEEINNLETNIFKPNSLESIRTIFNRLLKKATTF